jgi:SpoVK/Ycf46/Vps4 family AAA+-type ATPase
MTYELDTLRGGALARQGRRAVRTLNHTQIVASLRTAAADAETDVAMAKIEDATMATGTAMAAVARVGRMQRELEQLVPELASRLSYLGDDHALAMGELLADLRRGLRRC